MKKLLPIFILLGFLLSSGNVFAWYNASWGYRIPITVTSSKVDADLTNFPVYVDLSDMSSEFFTNAKSDGGDIRVTNSSDTELAREIVSFATSTETGELHFKADSLASTTDTTFYIYYGNSGASDYTATDTYGRNAVWADYEAVLHLNETTGGSGAFVDATGNGHDATDTGSPTLGQTGVMGNAILFDGLSNYLRLSSTTLNLTNLTISAWVHLDASPSFNNPILNVSGANRFMIRASSVYIEFDDVSTQNSTASHTDQWIYAMATRNGTTAKYYRNSTNAITWTVGANGANWASSYIAGSAYLLEGLVDELRVRAEALAPEWISTEYNNQSTTTAFYATSSQETAPSVSSVISTWNGIATSSIATMNGIPTSSIGTWNGFTW